MIEEKNRRPPELFELRERASKFGLYIRRVQLDLELFGAGTFIMKGNRQEVDEYLKNKEAEHAEKESESGG